MIFLCKQKKIYFTSRFQLSPCGRLISSLFTNHSISFTQTQGLSPTIAMETIFSFHNTWLHFKSWVARTFHTLFAGEVMTSFHCAARAFWFQTNHHPIDFTWCVWNQKSDYDVSVHQRIGSSIRELHDCIIHATFMLLLFAFSHVYLNLTMIPLSIVLFAIRQTRC